LPSTSLLARGPNRFCPDCGRWLVRVTEHGCDLAGNASMMLKGEIEIQEGTMPQETEMLVMEATCLLCHPDEKPKRRFLRWLGGWGRPS
jgi:hypothetical protein